MTTRRQRDGDDGKANAARITCQFRDKRNMVYELDCSGSKLSLTMSGEVAPDDVEQWKLGASFQAAGGPTPLEVSGRSRSEALTAMAAAWTQMGEQAGYPPLDWAAIRVALAAVRAV
jgi:hypothetical protein